MENNPRRSKRIREKEMSTRGENNGDTRDESTDAPPAPSKSQTTRASSTASRRRTLEAEKNLAIAKEKHRELKERREREDREAKERREREDREAKERREREDQEAESRKAVIEAEYEAELAALEDDGGGERVSTDEQPERVPSGRRHGSIHNWRTMNEQDHGTHFQENEVDEESREAEHLEGSHELKGAEKLAEALTKIIHISPTTSQQSNTLLGRMAVKALPDFYGDCKEWLSFKRAYENSTKVGKFTNYENMARLHECIKGKAKEAIGLRLITDNDPDNIIEILEMWFGKPKIIFEELIYEIKNVPSFSGKPVNTLFLATKVDNYIATAEALHKPQYLCNQELYDIIVHKFSEMQRRLWFDYLRGHDSNKPKLSILAAFLKIEARMAKDDDFETSNIFFQHKANTTHKIIPRYSNYPRQYNNYYDSKFKNEHPKPSPQNICQTVLATDSISKSDNRKTYLNNNGCLNCHKKHHITECYHFKNISVDERWEIVKKIKVCFNCLSTRHTRENCKAKPCSKCYRKHHQLLHHDRPVTENNEISVSGNYRPRMENSEISVPCNEITMNTWSSNKKILLKVIPVILYGPLGNIETFALLDEGSSISLVNQCVADKIGLKGNVEKLYLHGANGMKSEVDSKRVSFKISSDSSSRRYDVGNVRTVSSLQLPCQTITESELKRHEHLSGLPIKTYNSALVTVLLGVDNWNLIISREIRSGTKNALVATRCNLGWSIHGYTNATDTQRNNNSHISLHLHERDELHEMVKDFFKLENIGVAMKTRKNTEEERALNILKNTTKRIAENRWETGLLWKSEKVVLPDNENYAIRRLNIIERKMDRDDDYAKQYSTQIENLLEKGYAKKLEESRKPLWYLPHFCVVNPNKPGKYRLVFDAAAKTNGVSLNDTLLSGPDKLNLLMGTLFRFREHSVAVIGDIKEMFLQVKIQPDDQLAQCFLWRGMDRTKPPEKYVMTSLIFGATSSPCTAIYVKDYNAELFKAEFPRAVLAITRNHYMDDLLDSVSTIEEMKKLVENVDYIHKCGGFEVKNWASNKPEVLGDIESERKASGMINLSLEENMIERTLGLRWNPKEDTMLFDFSLRRLSQDIIRGTKKPTKREMLSAIMSIFDPIGMLSPFMIKAKILMQKVWRSGIHWDEMLNDEHLDKWNDWLIHLKKLSNCGVKRCYSTDSSTVDSYELHTFCDAGEKAYAAVAYWRIITKTNIEVTFVASKCRVTPLKPLSIPRIELQAALLASRLAATIIEEHDVNVTRKVFWTDSRTVWLWIHSDPRNFQTFIAQRLGEIDDLTEVNEWRWLPGTENVADEATKDDLKLDLDPGGRWFSGPIFLKQNEEDWPTINTTNIKVEKPDDLEYKAEFKPEYVNVTTRSVNIIETSRFSNWNRLINSMSYVLLFIKLCRKNSCKKEITPELRSEAENVLIKFIQNESFELDIKQIKSNGRVDARSRLVKVLPILDMNGILRIQGRITAAENVSEELKHPPILDGNHQYTRLLIEYEHRRNGHPSPETTVNELRQRYWILRLRPTVRTIVNQCVDCRKNKGRPQQPIMGNLPEARLGHHLRPFTYCGLDYFGPMNITIGRRREKRYGALFTCLTTRAVHIELAASLTTDSAIMATRRMTARRGAPIRIYSDNATNFRSANTELRDALQHLNENEIQAAFINKGTEWHHIPPLSPNMAGAWERLVRSFKVALQSTLNERAPTEEVLQTLLAEAENIINSRPLTHVSVNPDDEEALTPNHFLLGSSSGMTTPGIFHDSDMILRRAWRTGQRLADYFWKRWVREYLPTLQSRAKWTSESKPLQIGDLVIIADSSAPRNVWPRGRITATYPGKDNKIRVVDVQTTGGLFKRSASKIIVLIESHDENDSENA